MEVFLKIEHRKT
ncbi:rCG33585, partial [Rattus norvegicus]